MPKKQRVDQELVAQNICETPAQAQRLIMAGLVFDDATRAPIKTAGEQVVVGRALYVKPSGTWKNQREGYVSRGGAKLSGALQDFGIQPKNATCLDIGCSTGGFTDCLLQAGAARVCAVDVGFAQFDWQLRNDVRVHLLERCNFCTVDPAVLLDQTHGFNPNGFDLAVCDVSFMSIERLLDQVKTVLSPQGLFLSLIKPQFEAEKTQVEQGGVVKDPQVHIQVLERSCQALEQHGFTLLGLSSSPLVGAKGNHEFFVLAQPRIYQKDPADQGNSNNEHPQPQTQTNAVSKNAFLVSRSTKKEKDVSTPVYKNISLYEEPLCNNSLLGSR